MNIKHFVFLRFMPITLTLVLCGCSLSPLAKRSAAFGNSASLVIRGSSDAYLAVERTTYNASASSLVLDFDHSGFDRTKIRTFLPAHDLEVRQEVLKGLQAYADDLSQLSGDQAFGPLDEQTMALSQQLEVITQNGELQKLAPNANEDEAKGLATAIDTLAKILIERKRRRELPGIIAKMQPVLEQICTLFDRDLGSRPSNGKHGTGLRDQLWNEYDTLIDNQTDYIAGNKAQLLPAEKAAEIAKLPQLVADQQSADAALAATQTALHDLVETHRAMLLPQQAATFKDRLQLLIQDGQQIEQFYGSLASK